MQKVDSGADALRFDFRIGDHWHRGEVVELDDTALTVRFDLSGTEARLPLTTPRRQPQQ